MRTDSKWLINASLAGVILMQAACSSDQPLKQVAPPHFDPANPIVLNEYAVQKARAGDISTALILLERALLLTPDDARIRRNYDALRAFQKGQTIEQATAVVPAPGANAPLQLDAGTDIGLPNVPLWPSK
jgi:Flp pilus assembly protein TadD